jgi:hypothetical protein
MTNMRQPRFLLFRQQLDFVLRMAKSSIDFQARLARLAPEWAQILENAETMIDIDTVCIYIYIYIYVCINVTRYFILWVKKWVKHGETRWNTMYSSPGKATPREPLDLLQPGASVTCSCRFEARLVRTCTWYSCDVHVMFMWCSCDVHVGMVGDVFRWICLQPIQCLLLFESYIASPCGSQLSWVKRGFWLALICLTQFLWCSRIFDRFR